MRRFSIAGMVAVGVLASGPAHTREARHFSVSVAEQPLGDALIDFAVQANITIATPSRGFGVLQARQLRGRVTVEEGLRRLLAQSRYSFVRIDAVTFRIVEIRAPTPAILPAVEAAASDEIIVTAARQPRTLDRFAASASVVEADSLERMGASTASQLTEKVSGLAFTNLGPGRNKILIRSLSDGAVSGHTESTIGVYFGDSRVTYGAPDPDLKLVDIDRVEVLRGPQGVLYGGGSIGGIYRITPQTPSLDAATGFASASVESTRDGGIGTVAEGMINLPLIPDRLGIRLVGYRELTAGWLDNVGLGVPNANHTVREGVRASMSARLGDAWSVSAQVVRQGIDSADSQYTNALLDREARATRVLEPHDNDFSLLSIGVRGGLRIGQFESTTTILHHVFDSRFDASGTLTRFPADPNAVQFLDDQNDLQFLVEEARLSGVASPIPWTIGAFVSIGRLESQADIEQVSNGFEQTLYASARLDEIREYAIYGEASLPLAHGLEASLGLRLFRTELATGADTLSAAPDLADHLKDNQSHTGISPQIRLSWQPEPSVFYYVQASNGYRSGGFNAGARAIIEQSTPHPQPFRRYGPDELWSYEAGLKHAFLDQRMRLRGAVFLQDWENIQSDQLIVSGLPFTGNVGNAKVQGGEVEVDFAWTDSLSLSAHATFTEAEISRSEASFPVGVDAGLPGAPQLTAGGAIDFRRPLRGDAVFGFHAGATFVGGSLVTYSGSTSSEVGDYFDIRARVSIDVRSWRGTIYVENAADSANGTFSYGNIYQTGASSPMTPQRPRTIGAEIVRRF